VGDPLTGLVKRAHCCHFVFVCCVSIAAVDEVFVQTPHRAAAVARHGDDKYLPSQWEV
jgi:hypothetical protein